MIILKIFGIAVLITIALNIVEYTIVDWLNNMM